MDILKRNNVKVSGKGEKAMVFAHGFGCDQAMWRYVIPQFQENYKVIAFDLVGAGNSDLKAYSFEKYQDLDGYASDVLEIIDALKLEQVIYVGHSVSALIGIIAAVNRPEIFEHLILIGPSPSYINDGDYYGGFSKTQIDELLESLDDNHLGWSMAMAPVIMGNPDRKELGEELTNSFCRTNPEIASHFAKTTFLSDKRDIISRNKVPSLILQCSDDVIAPLKVGEYMHAHLPNSEFVLLEATGHCPNLSAPDETVAAINEYLKNAKSTVAVG